MGIGGSWRGGELESTYFSRALDVLRVRGDEAGLLVLVGCGHCVCDVDSRIVRLCSVYMEFSEISLDLLESYRRLARLVLKHIYDTRREVTDVTTSTCHMNARRAWRSVDVRSTARYWTVRKCYIYIAYT